MRSLAFLALILVFTGCFGGQGIHITATAPLLVQGYAYDGRQVSHATGNLTLRLDADKNTGSVSLDVRDPFRSYGLRWVSFSGRTAYQSGGIVADSDLWGDSGNGSTILPRTDVYVAAFGRVESILDGKPERDPGSLEPTINAILFVTKARYRDPDSFRIENKARSGLYDASKPDDAHINQIGAQAVILLFSARGELFRHYDFQDVRVYT